MPLLQGVAASSSPTHFPQQVSPRALHSYHLQHDVGSSGQAPYRQVISNSDTRSSIQEQERHQHLGQHSHQQYFAAPNNGLTDHQRASGLPAQSSHMPSVAMTGIQDAYGSSSASAAAARAGPGVGIDPSSSRMGYQYGSSVEPVPIQGNGAPPYSTSGKLPPSAVAKTHHTNGMPGGGGSTMPINQAHASSLGVPASSSSLPKTAASLMREGPRDFTVIKAVGDGSFGTVCLADWRSPLPSGTMLSPMQHPTTRPEYVGKRLVAIKRMKKPFKCWEDCMKLKELKSLLHIPQHPNIIPLYDAFLEPSTKELHFVFECMEGNLYQLTKSRKGRPLAGGLVADIFKQIINGLHHIHTHGYFHRDMKPENLLITTTGLDDYPASHPQAKPGTPPERDVIVIVKLADFGLARETASKPPYTEYVSTRWYRAPEVLLRSRDYSNPVDMWALGTILAELVNLKPMFPGESEVDQVLQICDVLGDPTAEYGKDSRGRARGGGPWEKGIHMAAIVGFQWPKTQPIKFTSLYSSRVPIELIDCIQDLLRYDPAARATTLDCQNHPYFSRVAPKLQPIKSRAPAVSEQRAGPNTQQQVLPSSVDPTAARQALPPSHSNMPVGARPAFGEGQAMPASMSDRSLQRVPFYRPQGDQQQSSTGMDTSMHQEEAAVPYAHRGSQYAAFPESVSMQSMSSQNYDPNTGALLQPGQRPEEVHSGMAPRGASFDRRRGWGAQPGFNGSGQGSDPYLAAPNAGGVDPGRGPSLSLPRMANSLQPSPGDVSKSSFDASGDQSGFLRSTTRVLEGASAQNPDSKKARKEAEKAAKQAEKAKRLAQEKAARDRARAVMQKRNQMIASSSNREQVEWLAASSPPDRMSDKSRGKQPLSQNMSPAHSPRTSDVRDISPNNAVSGYLSQPISPGVYGLPSPGGMQRPLFGGSAQLPFAAGQMRDNGRPISMQSYATGDSDPGPQGRGPPAGLAGVRNRQNSASSLSSGLDFIAQPGSYRYHHASSADSLRPTLEGASVSSLDQTLVSNMAAMSAAEGMRSGSTSPAPVQFMGTRPSVSRQSGRTRSRASSIQRAGSASPLHHTIAPRFHPYGMAGPPPASSHSQSSSHSHFSGFQLPSLQSIDDDRRTKGRTGQRRPSLQGAYRPGVSRGSVSSQSAIPETGNYIGMQSPIGAHGNAQYTGNVPSMVPEAGNQGYQQQAVNPMWGGGNGLRQAGLATSPTGRGPHEVGMSFASGPTSSSPPGHADYQNPHAQSSSGALGSGQRLPPFSALAAAASRDPRGGGSRGDEDDMVMEEQEQQQIYGSRAQGSYGYSHG